MSVALAAQNQDDRTHGTGNPWSVSISARREQPMSDPDNASDQEPKSKSRSVSDYLKHPLAIAIFTFLLSGVATTAFTKWLDHLSRARELSATLRTNATGSI